MIMHHVSCEPHRGLQLLTVQDHASKCTIDAASSRNAASSMMHVGFVWTLLQLYVRMLVTWLDISVTLVVQYRVIDCTVVYSVVCCVL